MSLQAQFDKEALDYLPRIKDLIKNSDNFESNQMQCKALYWINTSIKPINKMCNIEINSFENALISVFKDKNWIK